MSTRYVVSWVSECAGAMRRGYAFQPAAVGLWRDLVDAEAKGERGVSGASLAYSGPNGERHQESESTLLFKEGNSGNVGVFPSVRE